MEKLRSIQALRALAACGVVVFHTYDPGGKAAYGGAGVDLFFVISGFIMATVAQGVGAAKFAQDRLWRIYPMWWIAVVPWIILVPRDLFSILSSLTLWPIYGGDYVVPTLKVGWTLNLELLFYGGMLLAIATRPAVPILLYVLLLAGALTTSVEALHFAGSPLALEFLVGVVIARLPRHRLFGLFIPLALVLFATTPTFLADLEWSLDPQFALRRAIEWGFPAALVVWGAVSIEPLFRHRLFTGPVAIGDASYSIYLFHPIVSFGLDVYWPLRMLLAVAVGWAMHVLVERRIMARKRAPARRPRHELVEAPAAARQGT